MIAKSVMVGLTSDEFDAAVDAQQLAAQELTAVHTTDHGGRAVALVFRVPHVNPAAVGGSLSYVVVAADEVQNYMSRECLRAGCEAALVMRMEEVEREKAARMPQPAVNRTLDEPRSRSDEISRPAALPGDTGL